MIKPMRITIFTAGSQGDIQPCVLLGRGLQQAGYELLLAAPQNFAAQVQGAGLRFHPLRGDVQQIMTSDTGRGFMEKGGANPIRAMLSMRKMLGPVALQMAEDALAACQGADALVSLAVFAPFGKTIAEIQGIPLILVEPTPLLPSRLYPAPGWPLQVELGGWHNRLSGHAMLRMIWQWYSPSANQFRKRFGLPPLGGADFFRILASAPLLGAYSPIGHPPPPDWPATAHVTGYWFQDAQPDLAALRRAARLPGCRRASRVCRLRQHGRSQPRRTGDHRPAGAGPQRAARAAAHRLGRVGRAAGAAGMSSCCALRRTAGFSRAWRRWCITAVRGPQRKGCAPACRRWWRRSSSTSLSGGGASSELGVGPQPIPAKKLSAGKPGRGHPGRHAGCGHESTGRGIGQRHPPRGRHGQRGGHRPAVPGSMSMDKQNLGYEPIPYPKIRRLMVDGGRLGRQKHVIHGLVEFDVTDARKAIRQHRARSGEGLSFTAYFIACLGQRGETRTATCTLTAPGATGWCCSTRWM